MNKIATASFILCLGLCALPQPAHGMNSSQLEPLKKEVLSFGKHLMTNADKLIAAIPKNQQIIVCVGAIALGFGATYLACKNVFSHLPEIIAGSAMAVLCAYVAYKTWPK